MGKLYIEIYLLNGKYGISNESYLALYVYYYLKCPEAIEFILVLKKPTDGTETKQLILLKENFAIIFSKNITAAISKPVKLDTKLPAYENENLLISGVCAVCRQIIKESKGLTAPLLGFKGNCLSAPAEVSIWTKFMEIEMPECVHQILSIKKEDNDGNSYRLPKEVTQFENHLKQPMRVHNIQKILKPTVVTRALNQTTEHKFAEGFYLNLSDLILFANYTLIFRRIKRENFKNIFPLICGWYELVENELKNSNDFSELIDLQKSNDLSEFEFIVEESQLCSLYKCDPNRYNPKERLFTKQDSLDEVLKKIDDMNIEVNSFSSASYFDGLFAGWNDLPTEASPERGEIPSKRLTNKKNQLKNIVNAVLSIAKSGDRIVDFCSGCGHLGIILAYLLPECHIVFVENKAFSILRCMLRLEDLPLCNVSFVQCNIDYFVGNFNIGISLHACGTATDIVLEKCIRQKANFITCPCCYGSISPMPHVTYPLSKIYRDSLIEQDYLHIAHAADQSHYTEEISKQAMFQQGQRCMDIVDTDRKFFAEENGYQVVLTRLYPEKCSPKNRLLIGVYRI